MCETKIPCSVGILTYNSEKTLRRTLMSVKDFTDIIISDGGSTDGTLTLALEYGATVIEQHAKTCPSGHPDYPIEDFALERNRMLDAAKENWFLWLDSDEYISDELHSEVRAVCEEGSSISCHAYEIPIFRQDPDATVTYREWQQTYQVRFFNLRTGGRFERKMHEKFRFDVVKFSTGRLKGAWYVPISKPSFEVYKKAVHFRLSIMLSESVPANGWIFFQKAVFRPIKRIVGIVYKYICMRMLYPKKEVVPLGYVRNRMYSQWVTFYILTSLYFGNKK